MEVIHVPDIFIYRGGTLRSLRGQYIVKGGELHTFAAGSGIVQGGILYVLDGEDYAVRMVTGKQSVTIGITATEAMTLDWGDGAIETCNTGAASLTHNYSDNIDTHTVLIKGTAGAVTELYCQSNELMELDIAPCTALNILHCGFNNLRVLNVTGNTKLTNIVCSDNRLTTLDIACNVELIELRCNSNQLTRLNVSHNIRLVNLFCGNNQISSLDLSYTTDLTLLNCVNIPADQIYIANSLPDRTGIAAGNLLVSEIMTGVQNICTAKNWAITVM